MNNEPIIADLHNHSHYSDGTLRPKDLVREAAERGLKAFALTDHDTIMGCPEAAEACERFGLVFVPGVELSCRLEECEIHCLGYGFDPVDARLLERLRRLAEERVHRMERMLHRLRTLGFPAKDIREVYEHGGARGCVGRPHLAEAMVRWGWVASRREAFDCLLHDQGPVFTPRTVLGLDEAVRWITEAGGMAVLAHPHLYPRRLSLTKTVRLGIRGLELCYPGMPPSARRRYARFARRHGLTASGGSDSHGALTPRRRVGSMGLSEPQWESFRRDVESHG